MLTYQDKNIKIENRCSLLARLLGLLSMKTSFDLIFSNHKIRRHDEEARYIFRSI
jgi:hypothetical protein